MTSVARTDSVYMPQVQNSNMPLPDRYVDHPTYTEYVYKTSASTGKKFGVGFGSWLMPGLGQCINGQWGKGIGMFLGTVALAFAPVTATIGSLKTGASTAKVGTLAIIGCLGSFAIQIISAIDAVKNAKSETVQIVPKQQKNDSKEINYSV